MGGITTQTNTAKFKYLSRFLATTRTVQFNSLFLPYAQQIFTYPTTWKSLQLKQLQYFESEIYLKGVIHTALKSSNFALLIIENALVHGLNKLEKFKPDVSRHHLQKQFFFLFRSLLFLAGVILWIFEGSKADDNIEYK